MKEKSKRAGVPLVAGIVAILAVALLGANAPGATTPSAPLTSAPPIGSSKFVYSGTWKIEPVAERGTVNFNLNHAMSDSGRDVPLTQLGLTAAALRGDAHAIAFEMKTDAGSFVCRGTVSQGSGAGAFTFVPDERYVKAFNAMQQAPLTPGQQVQAGMFDLSTSYIDAVAAAGFGGMPFETFVSFGMFKVTPEFLRTLRADFPAVDSSAVIGARMASDEKNVDLHALHVDFPSADLDTIVALAVGGVTPAYVAALRAADVRGLSADVVGDLRAHGIDQPFADRLAAKGPHGLSPDEVVRLKYGSP
jgi:hypothetical protein